MSGETRLSLLVDLNATRAKAEAAGLKAEVDKLGASARSAGQGAAAGAGGLAKLGEAADAAGTSTEATGRSTATLAAQLAQLSPTMQAVANVHQMGEVAARSNAAAIASVVASQAELDDASRAALSAELARASALDALRAKFDPLFAAQRQYEVGLLEIAEAERLGALAADQAAAARARLAASFASLNPAVDGLTRSTAASAQSAGMMAAQWNDVIMMTLAGQSPMQLAIQQGTQMTQSFGQAGAAGALRMLGAGFVAMLNPMNLAVIAGIGLGSALVQALMSASDAQATAEETLKSYVEGLTALETSISAAKGMQIEYAEAVRSGNAIVLDALSKEAAARLALMELDKLELAEKARAADEAVAIDQAEFDRLSARVTARQNQLSKLLEADSRGTYAGGYLSGADEVGTLLPILEQERAEMEAQGRILEKNRLTRNLTKAEIEAMTAAELVARQMLSQIEDGTLAVTNGMSNATGQAQAFAAGLDRASGVLSGIAGKIAGLKLDRISAAAQLAALQAGQTPDAARIAGDVAAERAQLAPLLSAPTGAASFARDQLASLEADATQLAADKAAIAEILKSQSVGEADGPAGGTAAQANAMADLIARYQEEIGVLQALDPIQKAMAQNHEALAGATEAERDQLGLLIAEKQRLEQVQAKLTQIEQLGKNAFTGLATGALTFRGALANVLDGLAQMAASSAWDLLWSGGGKKKGSGLGGFLGGLLGLADGGRVTGQGGPREDNILIRASAGEYMVNAAATERNLPLVEAINAGAGPRQLAAILGGMMPAAPRFADGGRIGGSAPSGWLRGLTASQTAPAPAETREIALTVNVEGARGNGEIMEMVERGVRGGIEAFSRTGLPARVRQINANPRRMS